MDHLSSGYYKALTKLGAKMVQLAIDKPAFFRKHTKRFDKLREPAPV